MLETRMVALARLALATAGFVVAWLAL